MNLTQSQIDRLHVLTAELLDDTISPAEFDQLAEWLRLDLEAREFFVTYVDLHCLLRRRGVARGGETRKSMFQLPSGVEGLSTARSSQSGSSTLAPSRPRKALRFLMGSAGAHVLLRPVPPALSVVLILVAAPLLTLGFWAASLRGVGSDRSLVPEVVARLTSVRDVRWTDESAAPMSQSLLSEGQQLDLQSGFAEITFDSGPKVLLKGPAKFHVWSAQCGRLQTGALTAQIPPAAVGFRLESPAVDVVGLGAEFGLAVAPTGDAEVHVLAGEVAALFNNDGSDAFARRIDLKKDEAVRFVAGTNSVDRFAAAPDQFRGMVSVNEPPGDGKFWTSQAGNWANPDNWTTTTLPGTAGHMGIANGGRVVVDSAVDAGFLSLGWIRGPFVGEPSGHLEIIAGGSLLVRLREANVGVRKSNLLTTLRVAGGTLRVNAGGYLMIADEAGSKGKATIESGFVRLDDGDLWIGVLGGGEMEIGGGVVSVGRSIHMANEASGTGRLSVIGSTAEIDIGDDLLIGKKGQAELCYALDSTGVSPINVRQQVAIAQEGGRASLRVSLNGPAPNSDIVLINTLGEMPVVGDRFAGLPDESPITASFQGQTWTWRLSYDYDATTGRDGAGNDVALKFVRVVPATASPN